MNNLKLASDLYLDDWLSGLPDFENLPDVVCSEKYERYMKKLFDKMRGNKYHKFTRKATRCILIAAIILSLTVSAFAMPITRNYIINKFGDFFNYSVVSGDVNDIKGVSFNYVPSNFVLVDETTGDNYSYKSYTKENEHLKINIVSANYTVKFRNDDIDYETISNNKIDYMLFENKQYFLNGVLWNENNYIFTIQGNVSKEELMKIAKSVEFRTD